MSLKSAMLGTAGLTVAALASASASSQGSDSPSAQLARAQNLYASHCAACHGAELGGGQFAGALKGAGFLARWGQASAASLHDYIRTSMPPGRGGALGRQDYADLTALVLAANEAPAPVALPPDPARLAGDLSQIALPAAPAGDGGNQLGIGGISDRFPFPAGPVPVDRFAGYTPVTQAMLSDPAPENWLAWRRGHLGHGFSPLAQITADNVGQLQVAWSQALPAGPTMNEPLVRDGVLYVFGFGDEVFAFDAADGRQLWRYRRQLPEGTSPLSKKTLALYGDKLFVATSDLALLALDARSGRPVWDVAITDLPGFRSNGGPLAADGVVMVGLATQAPGGGLIAAFDAQTGSRLWQFRTVAASGTPGGDTWNNLPDAERRGGSVWTSGTYDPQTGLALWGVAQSYDTGPLRDVAPGASNDALFTNSTLAFEPRTGRLAWHFQHMANDQYDLDWVFERVIGTLEVGGRPRRVVITGGKEGLFDTIDAASGQYLGTADMGIQDFIIAIDPVSGRKTPDPAKLPGRDRDPVFMCPHAGGGRNWSPTAFVEGSGMLFVNARDTCMELRPAQNGFLTSGVDVYYAARPDSDGNFGVLQGLSMASGEVMWEHRRRAPYNAGILATAGGLLFSGAMDRQALAYDQETGRELWRSGLTGIPNASPITYQVDGRQYVAFVTGTGNPLAFGLPGFTPEIPLPDITSAQLTVFALPTGD